jgi:hypothetical protein
MMGVITCDAVGPAHDASNKRHKSVSIFSLSNLLPERQAGRMFWRYIELVFSFAFRRTTPVVDGLQILAASGLPALAKFAGFRMPASASNDVLAYIGLVAVAFVLLRLLSAPYFVWREQVGEVASLKVELSRPEKIELHRLAEIRAEAKAELIQLLAAMVFTAARKNPARDRAKIGAMVDRGVALCGRANTGRAFDVAFERLSHLCFDMCEAQESRGDGALAAEYINAMQQYLHEEIKGEALALQLPLGTVQGTPL